jgi:hypothetical protein
MGETRREQPLRIFLTRRQGITNRHCVSITFWAGVIRGIGDEPPSLAGPANAILIGRSANGLPEVLLNLPAGHGEIGG